MAVDVAHKTVVLQCVQKMCENGQLLVDLFVNYDCDLEGANLFERMVREGAGDGMGRACQAWPAKLGRWLKLRALLVRAVRGQSWRLEAKDCDCTDMATELVTLRKYLLPLQITALVRIAQGSLANDTTIQNPMEEQVLRFEVGLARGRQAGLQLHQL